jgi:hypothetical protein
MQARFPGSLARALVDGARVEPEARDEQQRGRQEEDEQPVGERSREQAAADRRVPLDERQAEVDCGVMRTRSFDPRAHLPTAFPPVPEPTGGCLVGEVMTSHRRLLSAFGLLNEQPGETRDSALEGHRPVGMIERLAGISEPARARLVGVEILPNVLSRELAAHVEPCLRPLVPLLLVEGMVGLVWLPEPADAIEQVHREDTAPLAGDPQLRLSSSSRGVAIRITLGAPGRPPAFDLYSVTVPLGHIVGTKLGSLRCSEEALFALAKPNREDLQLLAELLESRTILPAIDRDFELADVAEAMRYQGEGHPRGKVVVTIP